MTNPPTNKELIELRSRLLVSGDHPLTGLAADVVNIAGALLDERFKLGMIASLAKEGAKP